MHMDGLPLKHQTEVRLGCAFLCILLNQAIKTWKFMLMHRRMYRDEHVKIAVYYTIGRHEAHMKTDAYIEFYFSGELPAAFQHRGTKLFCRHKLVDSAIAVERIECSGGTKFSDLKRHVPGVFDIPYIKRANSYTFYAKNRDLIMHLAGKILDTEEVLHLMPNFALK